jgi:Integrase core domain
LDIPGADRTWLDTSRRGVLASDQLEGCGVRVSMDGGGRFLDNIFIETLWRSLKYEEVFIKAYGSVAEARRGIGAWFAFYNNERPHQALDYLTPSHAGASGGWRPVHARLKAPLRDVAELPGSQGTPYAVC